MESLFIEPTKSTPLIDFNTDSGTLIIKGESYPENSFKFFDPVLKWLDQFFVTITDTRLIKVEISLPYINTSSSKCILMLLEIMEEARKNGRNISIDWYHDKENESELECAMDFQDFVEMEFNLIET